MNIGTIGNMITIANGWQIIDFGFSLIKKKDKNEEERIAAKAFSRFFTINCLLVFLVVIAICASMVLVMKDISAGAGGAKRYGTVKGDSIRYVQGENKYMSIYEAGLGEYHLEDGDRILMLFDNQTDQFLSAIPQKQYDDNLISGVIKFFFIIFFCIIFLISWSVIGQGSVAREFSIFYALSLKRHNPAWIEDGRRELYEEQYRKKFAGKRSLWQTGALSIMYVLLLIGISTSGALVLAKVYAFLPDENLVLFSKIYGIVATLIYMIMFIKCAIWDERHRPLYSVNNHLLETQLLVRNEQGQIGYYTAEGVWAEVQKVKIIWQDDEMVKMKCFYYFPKTGGKYASRNYIGKKDAMYPLVMELVQKNRKTDKRPTGLWWRLLLVLFISILLFVSCLLLFSERDKNKGGIFDGKGVVSGREN